MNWPLRPYKKLKMPTHRSNRFINSIEVVYYGHKYRLNIFYADKKLGTFSIGVSHWRPSSSAHNAFQQEEVRRHRGPFGSLEEAVEEGMNLVKTIDREKYGSY